MILHQRPLRTIHDILSLTNSYSLSCSYYSAVHAKSRSQLMIFVSFPQKETEIPCSYNAPLSQLTSCTPTKSNLYLANSLATVVTEPHLYRLLSFNVPNLMPLFHCLGRTTVSVQARGTCICSVTKPFLAMWSRYHLECHRKELTL